MKGIEATNFCKCVRCHRMSQFVHLLPDDIRLCGICANELAYKALLAERQKPQPIPIKERR